MANSILIIIFGILLAEDIFTKSLVVKILKPVGEINVIDGFFYFTYVENRGMAFGMLKGARWFFIAATVIVLGLIFYYFVRCRRIHSPLILRVAAVLIGSGALGNLIDRIRLGYVVDFLRFEFFGHSFAVFNFADILVCCGTGLLCFYLLFLEGRKREE